ncbi:AraC family transcriptional regulator [Tianweitania populi]|uniref:Transcriptional regulator n=1 Tax=Tianweitania populi TaxID=1607949 RepID=A0A8J3DZA5_9HYPH|nr:helix-turn-helix transcriptional regulator [Tianweitania populi]GHD23571.1 transcriptional regulator [Tianweitania populi]
MKDLAKRHLAFHETPRPMAGMEIDYPSGSTTGMHDHPRAQLLYAIQGVMEVRSETGTWVVPPSRALWLRAGERHNVQMSGHVKIRTLFIDEEIAPLSRSCVIAISPLLRELILAAMSIPLDYDPVDRDGCVMRLILHEVRAMDVLPLHLPMPSEARAHNLCRDLLADPADTASAEVWARRAGIASKTMQRLFLRETGMSFAQWRQQARLLRALQRIAKGDRIIDVALDSGYASQSAFTAMFRRHFGMPPTGFYAVRDVTETAQA